MRRGGNIPLHTSYTCDTTIDFWTSDVFVLEHLLFDKRASQYEENEKYFFEIQKEQHYSLN